MEKTKIWKTGLVNLPDLEDNHAAESKSEETIPHYVRRGGGGIRTHISASILESARCEACKHIRLEKPFCRRTRDLSATPPCKRSGARARITIFRSRYCAHTSRAKSTIAETNTIDIVLSTLMRELIAGPAVSLNGSPTVSPMTAAACTGVFFPP